MAVDSQVLLELSLMNYSKKKKKWTQNVIGTGYLEEARSHLATCIPNGNHSLVVMSEKYFTMDGLALKKKKIRGLNRRLAII